MDRIVEGLLRSFSATFNINHLKEDERFECLATYLAVYRHYSASTFHPSDLITGAEGDTGIDGVAIIINNNLVSDVDAVEELLGINGYLDVTFVFIQAERSAGFETAKIGQFGYGVKDFFSDGKLVRNETIKNAAAITNKVFDHADKFKENPRCYLYYVTTGTWKDDQNLTARYSTEVGDLLATGNFSKVEFFPIGSDGIQKLHKQATNAVSKTFNFDQRLFIPDVAEVDEAHIGFIGAQTLMGLICDEGGRLIESLFYENVRGWEGYNEINKEIRSTLQGSSKDRFILLNNGVTVIARAARTTGHRVSIDDFQVVNGCQTSNVLYDNKDLLSEAVRVPLRLICTTNEDVREAVITATNRQTAIKTDQFFASKDLAKKIEEHLKSFEPSQRLYYERRSHQYDGTQEVPKARIVVHTNLVRSVGAMFYLEPHRANRNYKQLAENVGKTIFRDTDRLELYYVSAYAWFLLEELYRTKALDGRFKSARYHILLTARFKMDSAALPAWNSNDMKRRCEAMMKILWEKGDQLLLEAAMAVKELVNDNLDRDNIRTERVTKLIVDRFGKPQR